MVLPYRQGWSSAVMERGLLDDRPVVMSRIGGMAEQGSDHSSAILVDDDEELVAALRRLLAEDANDSPGRAARAARPVTGRARLRRR